MSLLLTLVTIAAILPPQIYSLNPPACASTNPSVPCTAGDKDNLSINRVNGTVADYNGDGAGDEDVNNNGTADGVGLLGRQTFHAVAEFFAFADHNRMPLRRIMIDWGDPDGRPNPTMGIYENRKPFCGGEDASGVKECTYIDASGQHWPGITCDPSSADAEKECKTLFPDSTFASCEYPVENNGNRFGNATRACEEGFFTFTHDYACTENELATNGKTVAQVKTANADLYARLRAMGLADNETVCAFKPKVQALDNWGWCNGSCGNGRDVGCFADDLVQDQCNPNDKTWPAEQGPWTPYKGEIIVVPKQP